MLDRTLRRLVACLAVLGVLGLALLPAEHIHAVRTEDGRQTEVVHRHVAAHHETAPSARVDDDDHHDEAVWMDSSFITPASATHLSPVSDLPDEDLWIARPPQTVSGTLSPARTSGHDPPWTRSHGLRAPPSPLV